MKLLDLAGERRWCAWRTEFRGPKNEPTKVPYSTGWASWKSNDPTTWITLAEAQSLGAGVGVALGPLGDGRILAGIDYDSCIGAEVAQWALEAIHSAGGGHVEVSPSGAGLKQFLLVSERLASDVAAGLFGTLGKRGGTVEKKPNPDGGKAVGIEAYLGLRFFTVTDDLLFGTDDLAELTVAGAEGVREAGRQIPNQNPLAAQCVTSRPTTPSWMSATDEASEIVARVAAAAQLRPVIAALLVDDRSVLGKKQSNSEVAWAISGQLADAGWTDEERIAVLTTHPLPALEEWREKHSQLGDWSRQLQRTIEGNEKSTPGRGEARALGPIVEPVTLEGEVIVDNESWKNLLQIAKNKEYRGNLNNARMALLEAPALKGMLAFNEFSDRVIFKRRPPYEKEYDWREGRSWVDSDRIQLAAWLQAEALQVSPDTAMEAAISVALDYRYDPVVDYLNRVEQIWDGKPRIDTWLTRFLGVKAGEYATAVASKSLIGSVARARLPGCKLDTIPTLEGEQGIYKSTTLLMLYGEEYFVDHLPDIHTKDAAIQLAGRWCVEIAEMDKLSKADASRVKSFVTTRVDVYRRPYGRVTEAVPRRGIFWATLNDAGRGYLQDETGNRRWWPVPCANIKVDLRRLQDERDQLWAEASYRWRKGESWWMNGQAETEQVQAVAARFDEDVWAPRIRNYILDRLKEPQKPNEEFSVSIPEILRGALYKTEDKWTRADQMRIARTLKADGWERKMAYFTDKEDKNNEIKPREWRYFRGSAIIIPFKVKDRTPTSATHQPFG